MRGEAVWRPVAVYIAIVGTAFSVYFAWRYSYYQLLFPNPVYAKVGFSPEVALRGFRYVASFALTFVTPILLLPTAGYVAWREAPKPVALALGTLSLAFPAYAVVVGGDWMAMGRFLVPGFAFGALLMGWLVAGLWEHLSSMVETATVARLVKPFVFAVLIGSTIAVGLLPTWNVHLVPALVLRHAFYFRYGWPRHTEYERWIDSNEHLHRSKEIALTLKQHFEPKDSVVTGAVGALGYYSGLHIYDKTGLVDRLVAMRELDASDALRMPGHDKRVDEGFFLHLEPTVIKFEIIDGPPPDRENPEYPLARRIRLRAKELQQWGRPSIPIWRRYAPKVIPLKPSPGGSRKALLILRLIKEAPHIATLPRPERVATRERRARKAWGDFFTGLDSALIEGDG